MGETVAMVGRFLEKIFIESGGECINLGKDEGN
jgi:hypothetical protein